jgi:colicin import membrane protein
LLPASSVTPRQPPQQSASLLNAHALNARRWPHSAAQQEQREALVKGATAQAVAAQQQQYVTQQHAAEEVRTVQQAAAQAAHEQQQAEAQAAYEQQQAAAQAAHERQQAEMAAQERQQAKAQAAHEAEQQRQREELVKASTPSTWQSSRGGGRRRLRPQLLAR